MDGGNSEWLLFRIDFNIVFTRLEILWLLGTVLCDGWSILLLPNMVGPMYL